MTILRLLLQSIFKTTKRKNQFLWFFDPFRRGSLLVIWPKNGSEVTTGQKRVRSDHKAKNGSEMTTNQFLPTPKATLVFKKESTQQSSSLICFRTVPCGLPLKKGHTPTIKSPTPDRYRHQYKSYARFKIQFSIVNFDSFGTAQNQLY